MEMANCHGNQQGIRLRDEIGRILIIRNKWFIINSVSPMQGWIPMWKTTKKIKENTFNVKMSRYFRLKPEPNISSK